MPTFVTLAKWTDEGIRNIKDSPKRRQAFEDRITSMGGTVKDAYLVMGEYDLVLVTEVPNDETAAKMALGTAMQGNVRTMTMRAFGREEMDKIVGSLPYVEDPATPDLRALTSRPASDLARRYWDRVAGGSTRGERTTAITSPGPLPAH